MKNLLLNSQLLIYSSLFFMVINISDGKVPVAAAKAPVAYAENDECMATLQQKNNELNSDENGILDEDEIEAYESCVHSVKATLNYKEDIDNYIFLLNCYTNLMDYYDISLDGEEADEKLEEIEDMIYDISEE